MDAINAAKNALKAVLEAVNGEKVLIFCDKNKIRVGNYFAYACIELGCWVRLVEVPDAVVRKTVPEKIREIIVNSDDADIFINILRGSAEETPFRISLTRLQTRRKIRLAHCPGITEDMLVFGALSLTGKEYKSMQNFAKKLINTLNGATAVSVTAPNGTNISFSVKGRTFFTDTYIDWKTMKWMNLPVGEVMVAPVETSMNGVLVCTTSVGGVGSVEEVIIHIKNGKVVRVGGSEKNLPRIEKALKIDEMASHVGEFAFGLNRKARLTAEFLEAEKTYGTCHVAFGSNTGFPGGRNTSKNHMDFLIEKPTVVVMCEGDRKIEPIVNGKYQI